MRSKILIICGTLAEAEKLRGLFDDSVWPITPAQAMTGLRVDAVLLTSSARRIIRSTDYLICWYNEVVFCRLTPNAKLPPIHGD